MLTARYLAGVAKPEYLLRPHQIGRRLWRELVRVRKRGPTVVGLPWGLDIVVDPNESIGWAIYTRGIYETAVTEALWRLAEPGDAVVDGGANIGYTASLLAARVGPRGTVHCFEPHPDVFSALYSNAGRCEGSQRCGSFVLYEAALGEREAVARLRVPAGFPRNQGTSWMEAADATGEGHGLPVRVVALDDVIGRDDNLAVVKLDLEGYELAAMKGMSRMLAERRVQSVMFEEQAPYPAATHRFLEKLGYLSFGIEHGLRGLKCAVGRRPRYDPTIGPPPNYVATLEPATTIERLERGFWESFGPARLLRR